MKLRTVALVIAGATLGFCQAANAIEKVGQAYLAPFGSFFVGDHERDVEDGVKGFGLGVGFGLEEHWNVELAAQRLNLDPNNSPASSASQTGVLFNALNVYNRDGRFSPYLLGGVGMVSTNVSGAPSKSNFQAQGGVGVFTELWPHRLALRTEVLYRWDDASSSFGDVLVNFGLQIPLGGAKAKVLDTDGDGVRDPADRCPGTPAGVRVDAIGCELDSDGDGVADRLDKCPDTPKGARVNTDGCPLDSDGDGVLDGVDHCPNTPNGAIVDAVGCPKDSDGDGVYDGIDKCPTTPKGAKVGPLGCSLALTLSGVNFDSNSARLLPEGEKILEEAIAALGEDPNSRVEIQGYTDSRGSDAFNLKLGEQRAGAVRNFLTSRGVRGDRLTTKSFGEAEPVADNNTAEGRARNRRVVLKPLL